MPYIPALYQVAQTLLEEYHNQVSPESFPGKAFGAFLIDHLNTIKAFCKQALDQAQLLNEAMEKKAKQFDRIVCEWKGKVDGLSIDTAQN